MSSKTPYKTPMPQQDPEKRRENFSEVALGYTPQMARAEASRCLRCRHKPCVNGCPVGVQIPEFITALAYGDDASAYEIIRRTNALPAICGRVCPQEAQCERLCVRGFKGEPVAIGRLERFAADSAMSKELPPPPSAEKNGKRVAVVGSGPAGLSCAGDLILRGYDVSIFEALHTPGGVLSYGIPEFRLPKALVQREIDILRSQGVNIHTNTVVGKTLTVEELFEEEGFDAVFIGSGAGLPNFQNIPGEALCGVYSANEFLTRVNLMKAYAFPEYDTPVRVGKQVAVIGGGNVAMDAARCALRLGAEEVSIVYRRSEAEMPARQEEIHHAQEEGIRFQILTSPTEILGDDQGFVRAMTCDPMELGAPDASGRRSVTPVPGSAFELPVQTVVIAIGNSPNPLIGKTTPGLTLNRWGCIEADAETGATSKPLVYAGGDVVTGAATVILAMGAGKKAAAAIHRALYACTR